MNQPTSMKPSTLLGLMICASFAFSGCQAAGEVADTNALTEAIPAVAATATDISPTHQRVIALITAGEDARARNDVQALLQTAQTLRDIGAHPVTGTEDLAKNWTVVAESMRTDEALTPPFRGRVSGPAYKKEDLAPAGSDTIEDIYYAAEQAQLTLETLSGARLTWSVYEADNADSPICQSQGETRQQACRFTPLWTAKYKIRITNDSAQDASYLFITN